MRPSLPSDFPEGTVFIIDGLSAAYTVALMCAGHSIRCIYECKEIQWRNVDFVALYDLLLADVDIREKRIESVPHPYFLQGGNLLGTIRKQRAFIRAIRERVPLDRSQTYCGCVTSSILLSNKENVSHILIDEGMDSIMTRHRLYSQGSAKWKDRLRETLASWLIPFRFHRDTPQITMASDEHKSIVLRKDYRDFRSRRFDTLVAPLRKHLEHSSKNVLTLVNGPPHMSATPLSSEQDIYAKYVEFNLQAIQRFIALHPAYADACFYLKTHPSLGIDSPLVVTLIAALATHSIFARNIWAGIIFEELPSIPAEACLATGQFNVALSLDASSTLWHVGQDQSLACFMPLDGIIDLNREVGTFGMLPLLEAQRELNRINGNHVTFF
jgi:hypothetical protein